MLSCNTLGCVNVECVRVHHPIEVFVKPAQVNEVTHTLALNLLKQGVLGNPTRAAQLVLLSKLLVVDLPRLLSTDLLCSLSLADSGDAMLAIDVKSSCKAPLQSQRSPYPGYIFQDKEG